MSALHLVESERHSRANPWTYDPATIAVIAVLPPTLRAIHSGRHSFSGVPLLPWKHSLTGQPAAKENRSASLYSHFTGQLA